jgi:hypothetical protein
MHIDTHIDQGISLISKKLFIRTKISFSVVRPSNG